MTDPRPVTDDALAELTRLAKAATPGPWSAEISGRGLPCVCSEDAWICGELSNGNGELRGEGAANAAYIAAAHPQAVLGLIEEIKAGREALHLWGRNPATGKLEQLSDECHNVAQREEFEATYRSIGWTEFRLEPAARAHLATPSGPRGGEEGRS